MADLVDWRDLKYSAENVGIGYEEFASKVAEKLSTIESVKDKILKFEDFIFGYNAAEESGMFNNQYDYVVEPEGSKYMAEFQAMSEYLITGVASDKYNEFLADGSCIVVAGTPGELGAVGVCVTDYGIHVVMATKIYDDQTLECDYVNKSGAKVSTAEDLKDVILDYSTGDNLYDYIKESLESAEKNNVMTSYQSNFIDIYGEESITLNEGVIDAMFAE
jgi:hypothetical protein